MSKKKKKKKGKKGKKKKPSLTKLEKEILNLTIENLQTKIEWRNNLCKAIRDNIELYRNAYEEENEDKVRSINALEKAIEEMSSLSQKVKAAIPMAKKLQMEAEKDNSNNLAADLIKLAEDKLSQDGQLQELRKNLVELEAYSVQHTDEKIAQTERELSAVEVRDLLPGIALNKSLEKVLQDEMQVIFEKKISVYQGEISSKIDFNLLRIAEETRWWENSGYILLNKKKILDQSNKSKMADLKNLKQEVKLCSKNCLHESSCLYDLKRKITALETHNQHLQEFQKEKMVLRNEGNYLAFLIEQYRIDSEYLQQDLETIVRNNQDEEVFIKSLEIKVMKENNYGFILTEIIKEILNLIEEEVKHILLITYEESVEKKDLLLELDNLLIKATKLIRERKYN